MHDDQIAGSCFDLKTSRGSSAESALICHHSFFPLFIMARKGGAIDINALLAEHDEVEAHNAKANEANEKARQKQEEIRAENERRRAANEKIQAQQKQQAASSGKAGVCASCKKAASGAFSNDIIPPPLSLATSRSPIYCFGPRHFSNLDFFIVDEYDMLLPSHAVMLVEARRLDRSRSLLVGGSYPRNSWNRKIHYFDAVWWSHKLYAGSLFFSRV